MQPVDTDSDKVPIITHVDNSLMEDEGLSEAKKGTELVVVENGMKSEEEKEQREDEDNLAEESVISMIGADDEEVRQVRVKADVSPDETAGQSVAQPLSSPSPPQPLAAETTLATMSSTGKEGKAEHEPVDSSLEIAEPVASTVVTVEPTTRVIYTVSRHA